MFVWSVPSLALRRVCGRVDQALDARSDWLSHCDGPPQLIWRRAHCHPFGIGLPGLRISRVRIAGVRLRGRASFNVLICRANLPGQKSQRRVARLVRLRVAACRLAADAASALDQLRCRSACNDSGPIGCEYARFRFHTASLAAHAKGECQALSSQPTYACAARRSTPHAQHRRKACRCSVSGAGTAPDAGDLGQGVSSNDNTMPGFSTARLSRPLLVSSVVTVTP